MSIRYIAALLIAVLGTLACGTGNAPGGGPPTAPPTPTADLTATITAVAARIEARQSTPRAAFTAPTPLPEPIATPVPTPKPEPALVGVARGFYADARTSTGHEYIVETGPVLARDAEGECQLLVTGRDADRVDKDWFLKPPEYGTEPSQSYWQPTITGHAMRPLGEDYCICRF